MLGVIEHLVWTVLSWDDFEVEKVLAGMLGL